MAIWIGEAGGIRIGRPESERIYTYINPSEVDPGSKRFGFADAGSALITGDQIWIRRVEESGQASSSLLDFVDPSGWVDNTRRNDGQWYVNADSVGGIRLFDNWRSAINNTYADAIALATPASTYRVSYEIVQSGADYLAQTVSWVLNTDRDVADYTSLGDSFKQQMSTLVSGSGELDCFFDTTWRGGAPVYSGQEESAIYMHRLALRQQIGAKFTGVFLMKRSQTVPIGTLIDASEASRELFYTADCIITSVATELIADQPIHSRITFVTTGPIQLVFSTPVSYLLQEQSPYDRILQESGFGVLLETPD